MNIDHLHQLLLSKAKNTSSASLFFKTGIGQYAHNDKFMGVSVPQLRVLAKQYKNIPMVEIEMLINSAFNEERLLALFILIHQYTAGPQKRQEEIYQFYLQHLACVNNWNLVDASAHLIMGAYLWKKDRGILYDLAQSSDLWQRRVAIIATFYFIRNNDLESTFSIAEKLLNDDQDLIHKAVGWMLREAGKRNENALIDFLAVHGKNMPRTMLRYAIEKFPEALRKKYLMKK